MKLVKPAPFEIVTQPVDCVAAVDTYGEFEVEAVNASSYLWQYSNDGGTTWLNAAGTRTNPVYRVLVKELRYGFIYRCELTELDGETKHYTDTVKLVKPAPFEIVTQPVDCVAAVDTYGEFEVEAVNASSYLWQYSNDGGTTWKNAAGTRTNPVYRVYVAELRYGFIYRCELTGLDGETKLYTDIVKLVRPGIVLDDVVYEIIEGTDNVRVKQYNGTASSLTIPTTVNGYAVKEIGEKAFENNTTLTSISLPNAITVIGKRAFAGCTALSSMNGHD